MTIFVKTDGTGDYPDIAAAVIGEAGDQGGVAVRWECSAPTGIKDVTQATISGITNYTSFNVVGDRSSAIYDTSAYAMEAAVTYGSLLQVDTPNTTISKLQIKNTGNAANNPTCLTFTGTADSSVAELSYMELSDSINTPGNFNHVFRAFADINYTIRNCVVVGYFKYGIRSDYGTVAVSRSIISNTVIGKGTPTYGIYMSSAAANTTALIDNIVQGAGANYATTQLDTIGSNISQDATSPDGASWQNITLTFENAAGGNYNLAAADTAAIDTGVDTSSYGVTSDFIGTSRPQNSIYDVGAFEYLSGGSPQTITPTGIASAEAFGTPGVSPGAVTISPPAIASAESFGSVTVTTGAVTLSPSAITSAEAFGNAIISTGALVVLPSSINSEENFGSLVINTGAVTIDVPGIGSGEAFGAATVAPGSVIIAPAGIESGELFGGALVIPGAVTVSPLAIDSAEQFGAVTIIGGALFIDWLIATLEASPALSVEIKAAPALSAEIISKPGGLH